MKTIEVIAKHARDSLADFCTSECKAYCCRKGYLLLSAKETDLVLDDQKEAMEKAGYLKKVHDKSSFFLGNPDSCASLDKKTCFCRIHDNELRPETCRHYPVFIKNKKILFSGRCLAVKQGIMYPFEKELIKNKIKFRNIGV